MNDINKLGDWIRDIGYEHFKHYWNAQNQDEATDARQRDRIESLKTVANFLDPLHATYYFRDRLDYEEFDRLELQEYYDSLEDKTIAKILNDE